MVYGPTQSNPVGGDHGDLVAALARFLQPWTYLEVGVGTGETFDKVIAALRVDAVAIGVDSTLRFVSHPCGRMLFEQDSVEFMKTRGAESIEMVFLDSSHEFEATMRELVEIERILIPNGVLVMHDTYPPNEAQAQPGYCGDVWRAATRLLEWNRWESMTLAAQYGLTVARKLPRTGKHLAWKA